MAYGWVDCDRAAVSERYDRIGWLLPAFDWLLFVPSGLRATAVKQLGLAPGGTVLDIGCGSGKNFSYLHYGVGDSGRIYGVDISGAMLRQARRFRDLRAWRNIDLIQSDVAEFCAPEPLDAVLFSLSYNTMPHHRTVLRHAWDQLRPGGRLVIMDAKIPEWGTTLLSPFSVWLMKHTLLSNPFIRPWEELEALADQTDMQEFLFGSYYICQGVKF